MRLRMTERTVMGVTDLRILTGRQPWAGAIIRDGKDVENRTRPIAYRGVLIIHANMLRRVPISYYMPIRKRPTVMHAETGLLGLVDLVDCIPYEQCESLWRIAPPYGKPGWCWKLANPRPFSGPIPAKGALGLWRPERLNPASRALLSEELRMLGVSV